MPMAALHPPLAAQQRSSQSTIMQKEMEIEDKQWTPGMAQDKQHPFWHLESDEEGYNKEGEDNLQDNGHKEPEDGEEKEEDKFGYYGNDPLLE